MKQAIRYRYGIKQHLVRDEGVGTKGVRYAAEEIEKAVIHFLLRFVSSSAEIVAALAIKDHSAGSLKRIISHAKALSEDLNDHQKVLRLISKVIDKVIIRQDALELRLQRHKLAGLLRADSRTEDSIHVIAPPCRLAWRGQDLKLVIPLLNESNTFSHRDPALIQPAAKAHLFRYQGRLS